MPGKTSNVEQVPVDGEALEQRTRIYSLNPQDKLYNYHKAINEAR